MANRVAIAREAFIGLTSGLAASLAVFEFFFMSFAGHAFYRNTLLDKGVPDAVSCSNGKHV